MRILFHGHDFDLTDDAGRALASRQYAEQMVDDIPGDEMDMLDVLETLLAGFVDFWLMAGATVKMAAAQKAPGITLAQAQAIINHVGHLIGQAPMSVILPENEAPAGADAAQQLDPADAARDSDPSGGIVLLDATS